MTRFTIYYLEDTICWQLASKEDLPPNAYYIDDLEVDDAQVMVDIVEWMQLAVNTAVIAFKDKIEGIREDMELTQHLAHTKKEDLN